MPSLPACWIRFDAGLKVGISCHIIPSRSSEIFLAFQEVVRIQTLSGFFPAPFVRKSD